MTTEIFNYLRRCAHPSFALAAAAKFLSRAFWFAFRRIWPNNRRFFQPYRIKQLRHSLLSHAHAQVDPPAPEELPRCSLALAVGSFEVDVGPNWSKEFRDEEITVSLHRWNWLLRGLTDDPVVLSREQGLKLMRSWIFNCQSRDAFGRDAYSTGERIVNGSLFLLLTSEDEIPPDICAAFRAMGRQIAANLEYHGSEQTGNHAFNNARALLFAGLAAKLPVAVDLALEISKERLPILVTTDGFMREGSSHYHFLFTRWVLEMLWYAERANNESFVRLLTPYAKLLVQRCWFFLVQSKVDYSWRIPLIGDVSPDCPPGWLIGLPWSSRACRVYRPDRMPRSTQHRSWADLFGVVAGAGSSEPEQIASYPASGWFRIDHEPWTVFIRAESNDGGLKASHQHHDLGSFVLFRHGSPVLVDPGRLDYTASLPGWYGKSSLAHNALRVDGLGATADGPGWFPDRYRAVQAEVDVKRQAEDTIITLRHNGFARLAPNPIRHQRRLKLNNSVFSIEDQLDGVGARQVRARFHFAPGLGLHRDEHNSWRLGESRMVFTSTGLSDEVVYLGRTSPPFGGLFFPAYGRQQVCPTLDLYGRVNCPIVLTHALRQEN